MTNNESWLSKALEQNSSSATINEQLLTRTQTW